MSEKIKCPSCVAGWHNGPGDNHEVPCYRCEGKNYIDAPAPLPKDGDLDTAGIAALQADVFGVKQVLANLAEFGKPIPWDGPMPPLAEEVYTALAECFSRQPKPETGDVEAVIQKLSKLRDASEEAMKTADTNGLQASSGYERGRMRAFAEAITIAYSARPPAPRLVDPGEGLYGMNRIIRDAVSKLDRDCNIDPESVTLAGEIIREAINRTLCNLPAGTEGGAT